MAARGPIGVVHRIVCHITLSFAFNLFVLGAIWTVSDAKSLQRPD